MGDDVTFGSRRSKPKLPFPAKQRVVFAIDGTSMLQRYPRRFGSVNRASACVLKGHRFDSSSPVSKTLFLDRNTPVHRAMRPRNRVTASHWEQTQAHRRGRRSNITARPSPGPRSLRSPRAALPTTRWVSKITSLHREGGGACGTAYTLCSVHDLTVRNTMNH